MRLRHRERQAFSTYLRRVRSDKMSQEAAAEAATRCLRKAADEEQLDTETAALFRSVDVTRHHVAGFENYPAAPMGTPEKRARLLGLVLAIEADRATVNRLGGGI